ncbi:LysR family transcriptional regulator [uncultured Aquitalea sp.]|uniref:LysR family transcriptional regulator n=1 Tax=uncultured Aquitalea sp. TaxID=540272 RepID=UPI0025DED956|nr:LysR family transcriptional regulator [uncultured Aquitalea sp.]
MQRLNYKHLHYFWTVAHAGSVTAAARQLDMTAQTVSGQISRLEQSMGRALFTQEGRQLVLTEAGRLALTYADRIFQLGEELEDSLREEEPGQTLRLTVGISDVLPKDIACRLLAPALSLPQKVRLQCLEGDVDELLAALARHQCDLVLADRPAPAGGAQPLQSTLLVRCPVMVFGNQVLHQRYAEGFPHSLNRAPMLLPIRENVLRGQLEHWMEEHGIRPDIVGEFQDGALLASFGKLGHALFPAPVYPGAEPEGMENGLFPLGAVSGVEEQYYAIANRRKLQHPAVAAMLD